LTYGSTTLSRYTSIKIAGLAAVTRPSLAAMTVVSPVFWMLVSLMLRLPLAGDHLYRRQQALAG
jgi:hypothetical protein